MSDQVIDKPLLNFEGRDFLSVESIQNRIACLKIDINLFSKRIKSCEERMEVVELFLKACEKKGVRDFAEDYFKNKSGRITPRIVLYTDEYSYYDSEDLDNDLELVKSDRKLMEHAERSVTFLEAFIQGYTASIKQVKRCNNGDS